MRKLSLGAIGPAVAILLLFAGTARAQTTGSIRGVVTTENTPLPGVLVEAKSSTLQGSRTATTDAEGRFTLTLLPPGTYTVWASLAGFGTRTQTLPLALNASSSIRFELRPETTATVSVNAEASEIASESTTVGRNLDSRLFQALPTGRNYADVVQLASGIGTDGSDSRNTSITVYGATGLENAYLVDGSNTTGVEFGNQGKVLNFEFVQEVEFKSGGYEAEYGKALGGILNVVTKSGGDEYHGDVFGYLNRDSLQADNKHLDEITSSGIPTGFSKADFGADFGGFLLKEKLWFFAAYDRVNNTQNTRIAQGPVAGTGTDVKTTSDLYAGKLTWRINGQHTLIGTIFGDPSDDVGAVVDPIGPRSTYEGTNTVGGTDYSLRYEGILNQKLLLMAQFGRHQEDVQLLPGPQGDQIRYEDNTGDVVSATGGFGRPQEGRFDKKTFTRTDYRLTGNYILAAHDVKGGFEFEHITADVNRFYSGGQFVQILNPLESDPLQRTVYGHQFFAGPDATVENPVSAPLVATPNHDMISAFLQDSWKVRPNLSLSLGVRWEKQLIRGLNDVTFIDIDHFSPRLGFTWDVANDTKTRLYGSYGQFVQSVPLDMNIRSLNGERDGTTFNFSPTDLACDPQADTEETPCEIKGTAVNDIDPNLKAQYQEEIILGVDRQVGADWTVGVKGIYRSLRRVIEDTYIPESGNYAFINPGSSVLAPEYGDARRYFRGIELVAQKRLANHWLAYASYLYSQLNGNFDGSFRAIGGANAKDPNITDDFDYPEFEVNAYGKLTLDRTHQVKAQVAYVFPFNLTASLSGSYSSGTPLSKVGWWNGYAGPELFLTERGSEGRSPGVYEFDTHFDYALAIKSVKVHFLLDVFNLLNRQQATTIDQVWAFDQADNESPTPTNSHYGKANTWQEPRTLRLGVRLSF